MVSTRLIVLPLPDPEAFIFETAALSPWHYLPRVCLRPKPLRSLLARMLIPASSRSVADRSPPVVIGSVPCSHIHHGFSQSCRLHSTDSGIGKRGRHIVQSSKGSAVVAQQNAVSRSRAEPTPRFDPTAPRRRHRRCWHDRHHRQLSCLRKHPGSLSEEALLRPTRSITSGRSCRPTHSCPETPATYASLPTCRH